MAKLAYTAEKSAWGALIVALGFIGSLLGQWWNDRDTVPPLPVVVNDLAGLPDSRIWITKNGKTLSDEEAKPIKDAVRKGDGIYGITGYPDGKAPVTKQVIIGESKPDVVPDPKPDDPPKPKPDPDDPPPIKEKGFRVLFVVENNPASPLAILPKEQQAALSSENVRAYLDRKCAKGQDGKTPEWRKFDQHATLAGETSVWKEAMALPRNVVPWVVVSNGVTGASVPLPENEAALMALLKKYGGE